MKKAFAILATGFLLAVNASAQDRELFKAGEVNLLAFGNYIENQDDHWGGGVGLQYFMTRHVGFGASTHMENFSGTFFENAIGELYVRIPIGSLPIAPYGVGSGGYEFGDEKWFGGGGAGAELRFSQTFGIFSDIQWIVHEGSKREDGIGVRFGIRIGTH